jgi:hypothetical protein
MPTSDERRHQWTNPPAQPRSELLDSVAISTRCIVLVTATQPFYEGVVSTPNKSSKYWYELTCESSRPP